MNREDRRRPGAGCRVAAAIAFISVLPFPAAASGYLNRQALGDIRYSFEFLPDSYFYVQISDPTLRQIKIDEMIRGVEMGLRMWQSIIPDLHMRRVDVAQANLKIQFGNFGSASCSSSNDWDGCGDPPTGANGNLDPDARVRFRDNGRLNVWAYDSKTFVSRRDVYFGYKPATLPPYRYHHPADEVNGVPSLGYVNGVFAQNGEDIATMTFHEFGHVLGMIHRELSDQDLKDWYGNPTLNGNSLIQGSEGYNQLPQGVYPDLQAYYNNPNRRYFGGGSYAYNNGNESYNPAFSGLDVTRSFVNNHYLGRPMNSTMPPGIPFLPTFRYNSRVVFATDISPAQVGPYQWSFPNISGLIRMGKPGVPDIYLTSNWEDALAKAQLNTPNELNPWFVTEIYPDFPTKNRLAAGPHHTVALRSGGTVWAWGRNQSGQLGVSPTTVPQTSTPRQVAGLSNIVSVAAGLHFSVALDITGILYAWGDNTAGSLGRNTSGGFSSTPTQVCNNSAWTSCYNNRYVSVSAGGLHVLALRNDGTLWSFGYNGEGQLGVGHNLNQTLPTQEITGSTWLAAAAGSNHSTAIKLNGTLWTSGYNAHGQLGIGNTQWQNSFTPEAFGYNLWKTHANGDHFTLGRDQDGALWGTGSNASHQLGQTTNPQPAYAVFTAVENEGTGPNWRKLTGGAEHAGGVQGDGSIWAWGSDSWGQLGLNIAVPGNYPQVNRIGSTNDWTSLHMGHFQTFGFRKDGSLWSWGYNQYGQLGNAAALPDMGRNALPVASRFGEIPTVNFTANTTNLTPANPDPGLKTPPYSIILLATGTSISNPAVLPVTVTPQPAPNIARVDFRSGSTTVATINYPGPYVRNWNLPRGRYTLTARAVDRLSTSVTSPAFSVDVDYINITHAAGGTSTVTLSTVSGLIDWVHWGHASNNAFNRRNVTAQFLNRQPTAFTTVNSTNHMGFHWTGGTPVGSPSPTPTRYGMRLEAGNNFSGFEIPAATSQKTLKVYVSVRSSKVTLSAYMKHGGSPAPSLISTWETASTTPQKRVFTIPFAAAASGDYLVVNVYQDPVGGSGSYVAVQAATLTSP